MQTLYSQRSSNIAKTWLLMAVFLGIVVAVGYGISWYFQNYIFLAIAIVFALGMNIFSYWNSHKVVLRMTGAQPVDKHAAPELYSIVENLAIRTGLPKPKVYLIDDPAPNAFATGRNPEHAVVAATTGLLQILDRNELEGVMAHEMAHIQNRDMLVMTVAVVLAGFIAMVADFFTHALLFGGDRDRHPAFLIAGVVGIILAPIAAQLIQMAISRKREYVADASGALMTRYPEGLASALEKISGHSQPMQKTSHATAHLFISDPFGKGKTRSFMQKLGGLFQTHPPAEDRIAKLRALDV
jgi:heat shock protein HtpX